MEIEQRLEFIRERMSEIEAEGSIAPPRTWIQKYVVPKPNGKKYYYYRVMEADNRKSRSGSIQGKFKLYLGTRHNPKYREYKAAIRRRNELQKLQRRYDRLYKLYEKLLSQQVSYGSEEERGSIALEAGRESIDPQNLVKTVEGIQETVEQLCGWMVTIAEKLGIAVPKLNLTSR